MRSAGFKGVLATVMYTSFLHGYILFPITTLLGVSVQLEMYEWDFNVLLDTFTSTINLQFNSSYPVINI